MISQNTDLSSWDTLYKQDAYYKVLHLHGVAEENDEVSTWVLKIP
jgi:hypothetical protein